MFAPTEGSSLAGQRGTGQGEVELGSGGGHGHWARFVRNGWTSMLSENAVNEDLLQLKGYYSILYSVEENPETTQFNQQLTLI